MSTKRIDATQCAAEVGPSRVVADALLRLKKELAYQTATVYDARPQCRLNAHHAGHHVSFAQSDADGDWWFAWPDDGAHAAFLKRVACQARPLPRGVDRGVDEDAEDCFLPEGHDGAHSNVWGDWWHGNDERIFDARHRL
jgi:hypothetical protein